VNGAHALLATLRANGVDVVFANPGTSEMHFVAALDDAPATRAVLCLFEGVATGAADGYARVTGRPAATLLHLGPGLANGWANLHNARRARSPVLNVVGDHATYHAALDAPLQSDLAALARALEGWVGRATSPDGVPDAVAAALYAALGPPGRVATLALPADVSWGQLADAPASWPVVERPAAARADAHALEHAARRLRAGRGAILVGGEACREGALDDAAAAAAATGASLLVETFPAVLERGRGRVEPERLIYLSEFAQAQLAPFETLVLVGAEEPVGFFAYPDVASRLVAEGCEVVALAPPGVDAPGALADLVAALGATPAPVASGEAPERPTGALTTATLAAAVGATLPEDVVVVDESNTSVVHLFGATRHAAPHRWLTLTGGSIGYGLPTAVGAALGSKGRVLALEADGSMMYTPQALWTMAREGLDVTVVALANRSYAILELERRRVGALELGAASARLLDLENPTLDLAGLASSLGVSAERVTSAEGLTAALERSYATPGPSFIEAVLPKGLG
jgi:acetolactate synthase-1/2/3 large subunit